MKTKIFTLFLFTFLSLNVFSQSYEKVTFQDLKEAADHINSTMCPLMVDSETRLDRSDAVPDSKDLIFQYSYTMVNYSKREIEQKLNMDTFKDIMDKQLIKLVSETDELELYRKNNVIFKYVYYDKNHIYLFCVTIGPDKYKNQI